MIGKTIQYIQEIAEMPGFSSYEEAYHPALMDIFTSWEGARVYHPEGNSLIVHIPGVNGHRIAISAHLDKINHFGENPPNRLTVQTDGQQITGQLDDAAGVGLCLALGEWMSSARSCDLWILLTEMEESMGLREHPHLLKNRGKGLWHGMGAARVSHFLIDRNLLPEAVITFDTTPLLKGRPGVAIYSGHWDYTGRMPSAGELKRTGELTDRLLGTDPAMLRSNNTNDYLVFGRELGSLNGGIPSVAIEPAIWPYHRKNEKIFVSDIVRILRTMQKFLGSFDGFED